MINSLKYILLICALCSSTPSVGAVFHIGIKTLELNASNRKIFISLSHNFKSTYARWREQRFGRPEEDRYGDRAYWKRGLEENEIVGSLSRPITFGEPFVRELLRTSNQALRWELSFESLQGWHQLFSLDFDSQAVLIPEIAKLISTNKEMLKIIATEGIVRLEKLTGGDCHSLIGCFDPVSRISLDDKLTESMQFDLWDAHAILGLVHYPKSNNFYFVDLMETIYLKSLLSGKIKNSYIPKKASSEIKISDHALIVVHASNAFDFDESARDGLNQLVQIFKTQNRPVIYLMHNDEAQDASWYLNDREPNIALFSTGGEHNVQLVTNSVSIAGGYFGKCHQSALKDAIVQHFHQNENDFTITIPMNAVYTENIFSTGKINTIVLLKNLFSNTTASKVENFIIQTIFPGLENNRHDMMGVPINFIEDPTGVKISADQYTIHLYIAEKLIKRAGTGPRQVNIRLTND